ncbi:hypothetical protein E1176_08785, partial [Fulvivirga sp. RKSG066]|uniref:carboxylesterase family protein n=1 Tax=Fulvivirga aurantia TaxID=2529383 RepID=UPI0012BC99A3
MNNPNQKMVRIMLFTAFTIGSLLVSALSYAQLNRTVEVSPAGTEYLLFKPNDYDPANDYPLLIYLHGAQAMGNNISCSYGKGLPGAINNSQNDFFDTLQMIIVAPHVKFGSSCNDFDNDFQWDVNSINEVVNDVINNNSIASDRIFGSGISLGAKGIWDYALDNPSLFAGIVPISGNAPKEDICDLESVAVWAIHGESDGAVPPDRGDGDRFGSATLVEELNNCDPDIPAYLTLLEAKGHNGWDQTYDLSSGYNIYEWMFKVRKNKVNNIAPLIELGPDITLLNPSTIVVKSFTYDPNGVISNYNWTQVSGPSVSFTSNQANLKLDPFNGANGTYQFKLEVTDNEGLTNDDLITINVTNSSSNPVVTALHLYDGENGVDLGPISNN